MAAPRPSWSFRAAVADRRGGLVVVAGRDDLTDSNVPMSFGFRYRGVWEQKDVPFIANSIAHLGDETLILGVHGYLLRWTAAGVSEEQIDATDAGPQNFGDLTDIRVIKDKSYAVGMARTAYRNDGPGNWMRIDHGVRTPEGDLSDAGFTSIDGFRDNDIYAVGWDGEIWHYNGSQWLNIESPTNVLLQRVVCAPDGVVYACGQHGVILKGRGSNWDIIENTLTRETFWGAAWFKQKLYLSTMRGLFVIDSSGLMALDLSFEKPPTTKASYYRLDSDEQTLWSIGRTTVLKSGDGAAWSEIPNP
jgi:hypothetical protein